MVAILKHQHLRKSEMGKSYREDQMTFEVDPKGRDLENAIMEDWVFIIENTFRGATLGNNEARK